LNINSQGTPTRANFNESTSICGPLEPPEGKLATGGHHSLRFKAKHKDDNPRLSSFRSLLEEVNQDLFEFPCIVSLS